MDRSCNPVVPYILLGAFGQSVVLYVLLALFLPQQMEAPASVLIWSLAAAGIVLINIGVAVSRSAPQPLGWAWNGAALVAQLNAPTDPYDTPLTYAARFQRKLIVGLALIESGAVLGFLLAFLGWARVPGFGLMGFALLAIAGLIPGVINGVRTIRELLRLAATPARR